MSQNRYAEHQKLVDEVLLAIGSTNKCRVYRNATGCARSMDGARIISFGLKGSPDIVGILSNGKWLGLEIKTGSGKQNKDQLNFEAMIRRFNGHYLVVRNAQEAVAFVSQVLENP